MLAGGARLIAARGLQGARIVDIVEEAQASIGVFYHRFGDKQGLIDALKADLLLAAQRAMRRYFRSLSDTVSTADAVQGLVHGIDRAVRRRRNLIAALLAGSGSPMPDDGAWRSLEEALAEMLWDRLGSQDSGPDPAARVRCSMAAAGLLRMIIMPALTDPDGQRRIDPLRARVIVALHARYLSAGRNGEPVR